MSKKQQPKTLTPFEIQFIDVWFNMGFNGRLAYKHLKPHVLNTTADAEASRILGKEKAIDYIELKREQIRLKEEIKLDFIVGQLTSIALDESTEEVLRDANGVIINRKTKSNNSARIQAIQQLIKIAGLDAPKKIDITTAGEKLNLKDLLGFDDGKNNS